MEERKTKTYADLPSNVTDFLLSDEVLDHYQRLAEDFHLSGKGHLDISRLTSDVILGEVALETFPKLLGDAFHLDREKTIMLARELAGKILLPIAKDVGDVAGAIRSWGGDPGAYLSGSPADSAGAQVATAAGLTLKDAVLLHRLGLIADSYKRGVRSAADTKAVLMRGTNIGGLELPADAADRVLSAIATTSVTPPTPPVERGGGQQPPPKPRPPAPVTPPNLPLKRGGTLPPEPELHLLTEADLLPSSALITPARDLLEGEEAQEVKRMEARAKKLHQAHPPLLKIEDAIAEIMRDANMGQADAETQKRFERILDAHLRDARDAYETRTQLENSMDKGGLGLSGRKLVDVMEVVERVVGEYHRDLAETVRQKKTQAISEKQKQAEAREGDLKKKEEQLLAKRYAEVTGRAPTEAVLPISPVGSRSSAAMSSEGNLTAQAAKIDLNRVKQAIAASRAPLIPASPRLSPGSAPISAGGRPKVQDVQFSRTLAGPLEELRTMDLTDFRRLSKVTDQAAAKIIDKVDLLETQGYDQKIAAIKAWRESPLNQMYVRLTREALEAGKSVPQLLEEKKSAGEDALKPAELSAILALNAKLRF